MSDTEHGVIYQAVMRNGYAVEIVCRCGVHKSAPAMPYMPTFGELLAEHMAEAKQQQIDYDDGRWCGQCRYGVVEDPPCCTKPAVVTS